MDKGTKRKRDANTPTLVYSAPGYSRFAKLFTESSLHEIKEIVRKRLELSSVSDFTLFYDTDIALVNDDDFDAFEVHAHSAGSVNVVVKVSSQTQASATNAGTPSAVSQTADHATLDDGAGANDPPRKKRKMAAVTPNPTASVSSAPKQKNRRGNAPLVENEAASAAPGTGSILTPETPGQEPERPNKKRKQKGTDSARAQFAVPVQAAGANQDPSTVSQERPKKKSKKVTDTDTTPKLTTSSKVVNGAEPTNDGEPQVEVDQRKPKSRKAPEQGPASLLKPSVSKKPTKKSEKDAQPDETLSAVKTSRASASEKRPKSQTNVESSSSEKAKKPAKGKKKVVEQSAEDVESPDQIEPETELNPAAEAFLNKWVQNRLSIAPASALESRAPDKAVQPPAKATKKSASSKSQKQGITTGDAATPCPVCQTSPFHLRYRCPVVLEGPGPIRKRIAELRQDPQSDHSQLIQELQGMAEKGERANKTNDPKNVNAHFPNLLPDAKKGGVSNPSVPIPGRELAGTSSQYQGNSSSSDDSDSELAPPRKMLPRRVDPHVDAELDAIIHGPGGPARLRVNDIVFEEEERDEDAESVVLANDEEEDLNFRRRSRKTEIASSDEGEDDEEEDGGTPAITIPEDRQLPVITISARPDSRRSSTRSATEPLTAIHMRPSQDIDRTGNTAVDDAMASDNVIFRVEGSKNPGVGPPDQSARTIHATPGSPSRDKKASPNVVRFRTHTPEKIPAPDDPIQPAEGFPPTPVQQTKAGRPPLTPRMSQRMKDRNGKIPVKLSQLEPPFSLTPTIRATSILCNDVVSDGQVDEDTSSQKTRTRSSTRSSAVPAPPPTTSSDAEQPATRRRGPNKTPQQRAQEADAKFTAKEERQKLRKEKAEAKALSKKGATTVGKTVAESLPTGPKSPEAEAKAKPLSKLIPNSGEEPPELLCTPMPPPPTSPAPMSRNEWTVLNSTSPHEEEEEEDRELSSMRDELRSSSPQLTNDGNGEAQDGPLFLPAESQIPFPYSQWGNSVPDDFCPASPKNSGDEEEEEEVAASMKSSQRPGTYRRLTDITSQPSARLFSSPTLAGAGFHPASFPRTKDKRDELYGSAPKEDDDSADSDSSAEDVPSHIPKSRRAGMATRS